jgi:lipoprotein-releasing system ATP-binding protein
MILLEAKKITKRYLYPTPVTLFHEIDLEINAGESVAISGKSGEGKTTLLHVLGGLEKFDSGSLMHFKSKPSLKIRNRHLGFIFQSFNLLEDFSVLENIQMPGKIGRFLTPEHKALTLLESVGLESKAYFPARLLSGGEKQRVAIVRALYNDPELIFADEPSGSLDAKNSQQISELLFHLIEKEKKGLLLVTHDPDLAKRCQKNYILTEGKLIRDF